MNPILAAKWGGALLVVAIIFGSGWTTCKWRYEASQAAQLKAVADAYQSQVLAREASEAKLQRVTDQYDAIKDLPDPATVGTAHRLLIAAATCNVLPATSSVAPGTQAPAALPGSAGRVELALNAVLEACAADAAQMNAILQLAP